MNETVLATINFVQGTMENNGKRYFHHREIHLTVYTARRDGLCADCRGKIAKGEQFAEGLYYQSYHLGCVAEMSMDEALEQSAARDADPATVARLRGQKYGVFSAVEIRHENTVAQGRRE